MAVTKTTKVAQDAGSSPAKFPLAMIDESGSGSGPFSGVLYICDPNTGSPITPLQNNGAVSQNGSWTVSIGGGSVGVSGPVAVTGTFWPTTQPISATALPLPAGAATSAGVAQIVTTLGTPMQQSGGSVSIAGALPLPTGAATDASVQAITTRLGAGPAQDSTVSSVVSGVGAVTDAAWGGSGSTSLVGGIKAVYGKLNGTLAISAAALPLPSGAATASAQSSQLTQETAMATALGAPTDSAWVSGSGSAIALLKKIAAGGGGGGGGAATIADGADTAEGATTDAAWSGSGAGSVIALLKSLWVKLSGTLAISATSLPLPSGAATAANQTSVITAVQSPRTGVAPVVSTALASSIVLKSSAGSLLDLDVAITDTSGWVMLFDGVSAPGDGAVIPKKFYPVDSNGTNGALYKRFDPPLLFSTGIVAVFSSTGPFSKTAVAKAAFSGQVI